MKFRSAFFTISLVSLSLGAGLELSFAVRADTAATPSPNVTKTAEDFSSPSWISSPWDTAGGKITLDKDVSPESKSANSLKVAVDFLGTGEFEHMEVTPLKPLYIPGNVQKITMRFKKDDARISPRVTFLDGWGRTRAGNVDLNWDPKLIPNEWTTVSFNVPATWVRPVAIEGINVHNFDFKSTKATVDFWVGDIEVETDVSQVDPVSGVLKSWTPEPNPADKAKALAKAPATPLVTVTCSTPEQGNVFTDTPPEVNLQIRNWKPGVLTGQGTFTVTDENGATADTWTEKLNVDSIVSLDHKIAATRYGLYTLNVALALSDGTKFAQTTTLARLPAQKELTDAQKLLSPYGINYHSAGTRIYGAFKKAGLYWFRDYAFSLEWMERAKGDDRRYAGWPYYPAIVHDYDKDGLIVLPVLFAIQPPTATQIGPTTEWSREISDIILAFPTIKFWEVSNEYDLAHTAQEVPIKWQNYLLYHKKFGELVSVLGDGKLTAVENGRAGIFPDQVETFVKSGDFDNIGVINSHYYTGFDPPEVSSHNYNTGDHSRDPVTGTLFDMLRATKRAAQADGKKRQSWLTEFGWDTKAGPIVTPEQQAAYLQREFLLCLASGTDKAFWFYNFDADQAVQFFDGCGLFTADLQPKLSLAAMAGLTSILPQPVYVGSINDGPNTAGYVFENNGEIVAGLWAIAGKGPKVTFQAKELYDYLGNKLDGLSADLKIAPVYAVGLDKSSGLYRQTAYELDTPFLMATAAGNPVEPVIVINNNRAQEIKATVKLTVPAGWTASKPEATVTVAPGERQEVHLPYVINPDEKLGVQTVTFTCQEGTETIKTITSSVVVQSPFEMEVGSISGPPGKTSIPVTVFNRSAYPQDGALQIKVPQAWQTPSATVAVTDIKPGETRVTPVEVTWGPDWQDGESASITFQPVKGTPEVAPIIPNQYHLHKANGLVLDGDLTKWPKEDELPGWMLGSTSGPANAKLWMAWAPDGLYGAVEVHDSKRKTDDPRHFWGGDVLELFLSTKSGEANSEMGDGDHHFWLMPDFKGNRVYVGRWKQKNDIDSSQYDLAGIKSTSRATSDGYVMEFFLPASVFDEFAPVSGGSLGLNLNLTIRGLKGDREIYWPRGKATQFSDHPGDWGRVKLN